MLAAADGDARSHPTWTDDSSVALWSAHVTDTNGTHDTIEFAVGTTDWNTINLDSGTNWTHPDGGAGTTIVLQGQVGNGTPDVIRSTSRTCSMPRSTRVRRSYRTR